MVNERFEFSESENELLQAIGEALLGVPSSELGNDYLQAITTYVQGLPSYFYGQIHLLLRVLNSRVTALLYVLRFQSFSTLPVEVRASFLYKWATSKIPTMRTGFITLKAICSWGYYSLERGVQDTGFPGIPLGQEHLVPTLLYGKEPWDPKSLEEVES